MRLIKQYVSSSVLKSTLVVLLAVCSLDVITTIVDQADSMRGDYTFPAVLEYTAYLIPKKLVTSIPIAVLIGVLFGLGQLASTSELTVMRAAGLSVRKLGWFAMRGALLIIFVGMFIAEYVAAPLELHAEAKRDIKRMGEEVAAIQDSDNGFWGLEGDEFFHVNTILPSGKMYGLVRFKFNEAYQLERVEFSEEALYLDGAWLLQDTSVLAINERSMAEDLVPESWWRSEMSPRVMQIVAADEANLSLRDLWYYANFLSSQGLDNRVYELTFWQKVLQPLASMSLVFIAISFVFGPLRQVTMGARIFTGVIVGIVFSTVQHILGPISLVYGLSPVLAVAIPILGCFVIGGYLLRRAK